MSYNDVATKPDFNEKLIELVRALPVDCSILELGSGFTTRLITKNLKEGQIFVSLEESKKWYNDIIQHESKMADYVRYSPLIDTKLGRKQFYQDIVDSKLFFGDEKFSLVVADGPTGGHRWPGMFLIWPLLASSYTILFDDTEREQYRAGIELWRHSNMATEEEIRNCVRYFNGWAMLEGKK